MIMISVVIIIKNNEEKIKDCLDSVGWADEVLAIDTGSTDKTPNIAKKAGARVVEFTKGSFDAWRNKGLKEAKGEWLLYIDSDERVTPELRNEIKSKILNSKSKIHYEAYAIPRRNFIFGKEFRYSGQYPDYQKRLFLRSKLRKWKGKIHEEPVFDGKLGHLKNPMIHIKHNNLQEMIEKTNNWSEIEARLMYDAKHPPMNIPRFISAMLREFYLRFIKQKAFLDGGEGIIYGIYQMYSRFISYAKLWEIQLNAGVSNNAYIEGRASGKFDL